MYFFLERGLALCASFLDSLIFWGRGWWTLCLFLDVFIFLEKGWALCLFLDVFIFYIYFNPF